MCQAGSTTLTYRAGPMTQPSRPGLTNPDMSSEPDDPDVLGWPNDDTNGWGEPNNTYKSVGPNDPNRTCRPDDPHGSDDLEVSSGLNKLNMLGHMGCQAG
ncbi:hypothetical protein DEO72_LG11g1183 [Vigna unguiculata]|uniref:Uncharacterized protein n=1 Tax=Vigna unguiculata TaxID=3917 RepID=A0A4D6NPM8_VIGUN|nr:hypothetical protein DEO72_LG11g1183 [Vigna unguiculata]